MKKIINNLFVLIPIAACLSIASCKTQSVSKTIAKTDCGTTATYAADIKPIMDNNCASTCHSAVKKVRGIDLSNYESVKSIATEKRFLSSIKHEGNYTPMPKNHDKLDDATITKISCWIEQGMVQ